jgi:transmembrane protein
MTLAAATSDRLRAPAVRTLALVLLTSAYWSSGLAKLLDFEGAQAEMRHFGLPVPALTAAVVIALQIGASLLLILGRLVWPAAAALAAFTLAATLLAHAFWTFPPAEQPRQFATFMEHMGLIGGFLLAALLIERSRR